MDEMPDNAEIAQKDKTAVWHHLTQHKNFETSDPFIVAEDRGMIVIDTKGNEYLDAISDGVWSVNVGYGRKRISEKVAQQLTKMCYYAGSGGTIPGALFADQLLKNAGSGPRLLF